MKNYVKCGDVQALTADRTLSSGDGLLVGFMFGVAQLDAQSGDSVECQIEGVVDLVKDSSTFSQGDKVYWDNTAHKATSTATSNKLIGYANQAQVTGDATVRVWLVGFAT